MSDNFRNELLDAFSDLQQSFNESLDNAKKQEIEFEQQCQLFKTNIDKSLQKARQSLSNNNPLAIQISIFSEQLAALNENWHNRIKNQDKGVKFRSGFNDSLLVFVFGKVKSGKSSLGNYIAWGDTDPTEALKNTKKIKPIYFSGERTNFERGDGDGEAQIKREFRVGATEATSSIQGFSLPGITWVDSPGLASATQDNERLAKDYVEHADLILYTMKSDEPGRASDIAEIFELFNNKNKKVLLLVTGSDILEYDEDENGEVIEQLVMKSETDRRLQKKAIKGEYDKYAMLKNQDKLTDNIEINADDIMSISAHYAQQNVEDYEGFVDSGMMDLFDILKNITKNDGIRLKKNTPLNNLLNFILLFEQDLVEFKNATNGFYKVIGDIKKEIPRKVSKHTTNIQRTISQMIDDKLGKLEVYRDDSEEMNKLIKSTALEIKEINNNLIMDAKQTILSEVVSDIAHQVAYIENNNDFLQSLEFNESKKIEKIADSVSKGTRRRNGGIGALFGGFIGFVVGGPVGAVAGSMAGQQIGRSTGDDANVVYKDIEMKTGDNFIEIQKIFSKNMDEFIKKSMNDFEEKTLEQVLSKANYLLNDIESNINIFQDYLEKCQNDIRQQMIK